MSESMDNLLRDTLDRGTGWHESPACLDAEMAAAFCDETLSRHERTRVEAHVAECGRCQALLAALARTSPPVARAWWRRRAVAWVAPLTAAATVAIVWVSVSRAPDPPLQMTTFSGAPPVPAEDTARLQDERDAVAPPAPKPETARPTARERTTSRAPVVPPRDAANGSPRGAASGSPPEAASVAQRREEQPQPPPGAQAADAEKRADTGAVLQESVVAGASPQPIAPPPVAAAAPVASAAPASQPTPATAEIRSLRATAPSALARRIAAARESAIISANGVSQWRIVAGGLVQHSADKGATWQTQSIGANAFAAAGSSPSPPVCWLVGAAGLVAITTDEGRSWERLAFPVTVDLISVRAADDQSATVVTADGRTFRTSDRGRSWR